MSGSKYANLPDIDTSAPDVYETEDIFPSAHETKNDSEDEELPARPQVRGKNGDVPGKEELDSSSIRTEEASKRFKKAEKRHHRPRIQYTYPPSPSSSPSPPASPLPTLALPLSQRLRLLQAEVDALEAELADPSNPQLIKEKEARHVEPGELIKGVVDVKGRLEKITGIQDGRTKLVSVILGEETRSETIDKSSPVTKPSPGPPAGVDDKERKTLDVKDIAQMDKRVGELEKIVGSSSTSLDELSPLPPPLLPLLTKLNNQLAVLTQPRHIDSISRRLKLVIADLERVSNANAQQHNSQRRQSGHPSGLGSSTSHAASPTTASPAGPPAIQDQLTPIMTRLAPLLPHIPHILTRLRTLSTLHASAAGFQSTLAGLEDEQRKVRSALAELERAVEGVEHSLVENEKLVRNNVQELEDRVDAVGKKVEELKTQKS
ncbi:hypothetical protein CERSUDRAFT_114457 [Gelatoporia subvermispora B]|uniref:Uncharacterized protein n=1 Tax=Ceriporiopsis subvermispora (strain B) TaxID=914234 RepID=M2PN00_CERS8|nr:hypothetical protein CERSUDRAFT_114457 [Gelatoporia subvermispora B]